MARFIMKLSDTGVFSLTGKPGEQVMDFIQEDVTFTTRFENRFMYDPDDNVVSLELKDAKDYEHLYNFLMNERFYNIQTHPDMTHIPTLGNIASIAKRRAQIPQTTSTENQNSSNTNTNAALSQSTMRPQRFSGQLRSPAHSQHSVSTHSTSSSSEIGPGDSSSQQGNESNNNNNAQQQGQTQQRGKQLFNKMKNFFSKH